RDGHPLTVFCLDAVAIGDIDYTAAAVLRRVHHQLAARGARLVMSEVAPPVRVELDRYGITELIGADAFYPSAKDVVRDTREAM
ncbi:MAG: STAS domain-containing protein, partial [Intrasporangium sp.]|uniref:STAS domain-containing protein n=1 Tax=Intrasporangium sp. TaxID=1925024 RepID=UPI003F7D53CE